METKKLVKTLLFGLSFLVITVAYNNCGSPDSSAEGSSLEANSTDIIPIPNTKTTSVVRASRVLDTLVACLNTIKPSNASRNEWNNSKGAISEEGLANSLSQPMIKSLVGISAEVCNDLINKERNMASADRVIFKNIDFNAGNLTAPQMSSATKRLSRSCWGRNPSSQEVSAILTDVNGSFASAPNDGQTTTRKMIFMCTAMASSFSTYEM